MVAHRIAFAVDKLAECATRPVQRVGDELVLGIDEDVRLCEDGP